MRLIIAEEKHDHWSAHFEEAPEIAFGGETPLDAVQRLCEARGLDEATFACDYAKSAKTRRVFVPIRKPCSDCDGTGRHRGHLTNKDCTTCSGSGRME